MPSPGPRELHGIAAGGIDAARAMLTVLPRIDALLDRAERTVGRLDAVVSRLEDVDSQTRTVLADTEATRRRAHRFVDDVAQRIGSPELEAFASAIHDIPAIARQLDDRVVPALDTLRSVAPDLAQLLKTSRALNEIMATVPGLGRAKRRVESEDVSDRQEHGRESS